MPSKSKKQERFMAAAAHNPKFAKKAGIDQGTAQEFHAADQRKKKGYAKGGPVYSDTKPIDMVDPNKMGGPTRIRRFIPQNPQLDIMPEVQPDMKLRKRILTTAQASGQEYALGGLITQSDLSNLQSDQKIQDAMLFEPEKVPDLLTQAQTLLGRNRAQERINLIGSNLGSSAARKAYKQFTAQGIEGLTFANGGLISSMARKKGYAEGGVVDDEEERRRRAGLSPLAPPILPSPTSAGGLETASRRNIPIEPSAQPNRLSNDVAPFSAIRNLIPGESLRGIPQAGVLPLIKDLVTPRLQSTAPASQADVRRVDNAIFAQNPLPATAPPSDLPVPTEADTSAGILRTSSQPDRMSAPTLGPIASLAAQPQNQASERDRLNREIMEAFQRGEDRGLPYIGGGDSTPGPAPAPTAAPPTQTQPRPSAGPAKAIQVPQQYLPLFDAAEKQYNLPKGLLASMAAVESNFNPKAIGPQTRYGQAKGMMQFMDPTAKQYGVQDPFNPSQAVPGAARYMRYLIDRFGGNLDNAIMAYNTGEGNVDRYLRGGRLAAETQAYLPKVRAGFSESQPSGPVQTASFAGQPQQVQPTGDAGGGLNAGPLRQPIEVIRGLQRSAFDPYTQTEIPIVPTGTPPQLQILAQLAKNGQLTAPLAQAAGELFRGETELKKQQLATQGARDVATIQAGASGDAMSRVMGRLLEDAVRTGKPLSPETAEILKSFQKPADASKRYIKIENEELAPDKITKIKTERLFDTETRQVIDLPPSLDKNAARLAAQRLVKEGKAKKEEVNERLRAAGIPPI